MGSVSLITQNRLFWLGRYSERVYTTIQFTLDQYDRMIDGEGGDHKAFCRNMGIPCPTEDPYEFVRMYTFDSSYPFSIAASVDNMLGNGMVLRETISTASLSYLQLAQNALAVARESRGPGVQLQWVMDDIMAFRGSLDDGVESDNIRNIIKTGGLVERLSIMLRCGYKLDRLRPEMMKLLDRMYKTDLTVHKGPLDTVNDYAMNGAELDYGTLLSAVEGLFEV